MALESGGDMPTNLNIADANQAIALLASFHHWSATKVNDRHRTRGYSVTITHMGRRVTARRRMFVDAVIAAVAKLKDKTDGDSQPPTLRLAK